MWAYSYQFNGIETEPETKIKQKKTEYDVKYDNIRLYSVSQSASSFRLLFKQ